MDFRLLGTIAAHGSDGPVPLGGGKQQAVLAVLLLHANEPVSAERLALALWGEDSPPRAVRNAQVYVSRLRKALGEPEILATTPAGYRLRVRPGELDVERFEQLLDDGRARSPRASPSTRPRRCAQRSSCGRGPRSEGSSSSRSPEPRSCGSRAAPDGGRSPRSGRPRRRPPRGAHPGAAPARRVETLRASALAGHLMLALYRCGRQVDALDVYRQTRARDAATTSASSRGRSCARLQEAILNHDPSLDAAPPADELRRSSTQRRAAVRRSRRGARAPARALAPRAGRRGRGRRARRRNRHRAHARRGTAGGRGPRQRRDGPVPPRRGLRPRRARGTHDARPTARRCSSPTTSTPRAASGCRACCASSPPSREAACWRSRSSTRGRPRSTPASRRSRLARWTRAPQGRSPPPTRPQPRSRTSPPSGSRGVGGVPRRLHETVVPVGSPRGRNAASARSPSAPRAAAPSCGPRRTS